MQQSFGFNVVCSQYLCSDFTNVSVKTCAIISVGTRLSAKKKIVFELLFRKFLSKRL